MSKGDDTNLQIIGAKLAALRKSRSLRQSDIAHRMNVRIDHVKHIEQGHPSTRVEMLWSYCESVAYEPGKLFDVIRAGAGEDGIVRFVATPLSEADKQIRGIDLRKGRPQRRSHR